MCCCVEPKAEETLRGENGKERAAVSGEMTQMCSYQGEQREENAPPEERVREKERLGGETWGGR